jgi:Protein of unknown function (DUF1761)
MNILVIFLAAAIPLIVGFVWYNSALGFGKAWMQEIGMNEEALQKNFNPIKTFGFTYFFGLLLAGALLPMVIHQMGLTSMLMGVPGVEDPTTEVGKCLNFLNDNYGHNFRTFKHGAFHGTMFGLFLSLAIVGVSGLFERRTWRYIFIHVGYWVVTMALMGGVLSAWA